MIGIIGAMVEEIEQIKERMENVQQTGHAGITYLSGNFGGKEIVLCKSGVGKVNASVCTQILIDQFAVTKVIFTGVAGALNPVLDIGDIVVSRDCQHHDLDATALGFKRGEIPFTSVSLFAADEELVRLALQVSQEIVSGKVVAGRILSGDQFIADRDTVRSLHKELHGDCTEMEGAAVAQVCVMNYVPFVIVRSMSDKADGSADVNFAKFARLAAKQSSEIVSQMLHHL